MKAQAGFTVIELMTVSIISTVIAGGVITMLYLGNTNIKEALALGRIAKVYDVASEHIHRVGNEAYTVSGDMEALPLASIPGPSYVSGFSRLTFFDQANDTIGSVRVRSDGYLMEWRKGTGFQVFTVGTDSIYVDNQNNFAIAPGRKAFSFDLDIVKTLYGTTHTLSSPTEVVLCRNTPN